MQVEIIGDASSLEKAFGKASDSSSSFGDKLGKASTVASAGLVAVGVGAVKLAQDASGLEESVNAVNVVFGDAAGKVSAFSKIAAEEAGLSMRSFNELVTPVGASLQNVGFSADQAATASISLAKRAADMASVFNVDVSEALEAIQSGLRGEADPLERFGVGLSEAAVKSKAMTMGLADSEAQLTANDKAQARLALIMQQSNKVAGDFKNTSDSLANSQRINAAEAENQRAKFGQGLLPVMENLQGVIRSVTGLLGEHTTATTVVTGVLIGMAAAVLAVSAALKVAAAAKAIATAAQWLYNAALAANPIALVIVGLVALAAALIVAWQRSETFRTVVTAAFNAVRDVVLTVVGVYLTAISKFIGGIAAVLEAATRIPGIGDKFKGLAESVRGAQATVDGLRYSIDSLKSKEITITTVHKTYSQEFRVPGVAGSRAHGGPVTGGSTYLVGERGPELFTARKSGTIIPNGGTARSAAGGPNVYVTVQGSVTSERNLAASIRDEIIRMSKRNGYTDGLIGA